jgi:hypothetical protein
MREHLTKKRNISLTSVSIVALILLFFGCAADDRYLPMQEQAVGANERLIPNASAVGALVNANGSSTGCSVAFLNDRFAITAARCITQANPASYMVVTESPIEPSSPKIMLASLIVHPLWNSAEISQSRNHVVSVRNQMPGYYGGTASYDLAILSLVTPKLDGVYFEPVSSMSSFFEVETLFFSASVAGESRDGSQLSLIEQNTTTLTSLDYSPLSNTLGGGAALKRIDEGGTVGSVLVGLASGGDGQGVMFTRISPHMAFIGDVIRGEYSANVDPNRYRIQVDGPSSMMTDPIEMNPPLPFDCTMMSDGFCDPNCRTGEDIDCIITVEEPTGSTFGAPCIEGTDCLSRLCLGITEIRYICSAFCNPFRPNDCPPGFSCIPDTDGDHVCGPTPETVMMSTGEPTELRLFGANCQNDAQCTTQACITHQGQMWCSQRCSSDDQCPLSYECGAVTGGRACIPPQ